LYPFIRLRVAENVTRDLVDEVWIGNFRGKQGDIAPEAGVHGLEPSGIQRERASALGRSPL
jgi:hypothetical protein